MNRLMDDNRVLFRFYEELNDFLPPSRRKISFPYSYKGTPSVKDAIESLGVPHVEVDLILVNSKPVDFSYLLENGDVISVYPVFESIDISAANRLRPKPLRNSRFILDAHLGKLAKYLRLLGFDTLFFNHISDNEIISISLQERRIILTRDRNLLKHKQVTHGYWVRSQKPKKQLEEIAGRLDLKNSAIPFTRCMECNSIITMISKDAVLENLQQKTREYYNNFRKCQGCGRIYWEGSHFESMQKLVDSILSG
ncbi:MAG TPA: Mut7-C RNAse domain-containing protein [Bacteroidales bacterium]|jgi:hypothetical protein|nr:Mut7-C RNAse domain-containing protein [Bacteroidales bacterium]